MGSAGRILGTFLDHPTAIETPIHIVQFGAEQIAAFGGAKLAVSAACACSPVEPFPCFDDTTPTHQCSR